MATRRMFNLDFLLSYPYFTLPPRVKALYFALMAAADDDGFFALTSTLKHIHRIKQIDLDLLIEREMIHLFDSNIGVILHWRVHNTVQKDRYIPTKYIRERNRLRLDSYRIYRLLDTALDPKV